MPTQGKVKGKLVGDYTAPSYLLKEAAREGFNDEEAINGFKDQQVTNDYKQKRYQRKLDLDLERPKTYKERMVEREFEREEARVKKEIEGIEKDKPKIEQRVRKRRWDVTPEEYEQKNNKRLETIHLPTNETEQAESNLLTLHKGEKIPIINGLPLTDSILDKILPSGYVKATAPEGYDNHDAIPDITDVPINYYVPPTEAMDSQQKSLIEAEIPSEIPDVHGIMFFKKEDMKYFGKLVRSDASKASPEDRKELKAMRLLLRIKNGSQISRKRAMRQLTEEARKIGPKTLFNQILPLLLEPNLDEQERHLLVKVMNRILYQLDDLIRPYTHQVLQVVSPLLIEEEFTVRLEAREVISNLTKAVGLANMISNLRPDIDHVDEYTRNITSRVLAIVANTMGIVKFLPFLKAIIKSKKNWTARHTGIKTVQQLCVLLGGGNGNSILPYLTQLIEVLRPGLSDEVLSIRLITALTLSQVAESVKPYGIESFESILEPAWWGLKKHRGKGLAGFLKCMGSVVSLMSHDVNYEEYANFYTKELLLVIRREFSSPDEEMRKSILRVLNELPLSRQMTPNYQIELIDPFFKKFWNRRTASDSIQLCKLVIETTGKLANSFDVFEILEAIVEFAKNDNEPLRKMAIEAINKIVKSDVDNLLGLDYQLETKLVDAILYAFQEQTVFHRIYLLAFESVAKALNTRLKPHLNSIISTILYRLKNKSPEVREQSSDLISIIAPVIKNSSEGDDTVLSKLILIIYESLGEVYPEVLGSLINALYSCMENVDVASVQLNTNLSVNQILPTLTPILKNRQEKVQEACIRLVGLIARRYSETINAKEWMRICFELLDMLKSSKKKIRIAANDTFGYIAKTIGPQDVIVMLLNNLKVQERQLRVCTAVAIGIVAESCAPFTVLPALMNEYRIPEKNVQNGVLKALSFIFEYIDGNMTKDYLFAITPLLEDALTDRDQVHRQTAANVIKHMALNCVGLTNDDYYDVFIHFLNLLVPNLFETSPHVINSILEGIEAIRNVVGIGSFSNYMWAGLFHPAKKVRYSYWRVYNSAYVQNSDNIVPYYPKLDTLPDSSENYSIEEFDIFI